jgi:predicted dehydrogenase
MRPKMVHCQRLTPFAGRSLDIGVVLDLMIHDVDLVLTLVPAPVREVEAMGVSVLGGQEDLAQARLRFANGCVAHLTASRLNPSAVRRLDVWSCEGHAAADLHQRKLTLTQPSEALLRLRAEGRVPDPATLASLRAGLFTDYLSRCELECTTDGPDQLTRELDDFVSAVRTGSKVRVPGEQGREALAVACLILDAIRRHAWEGEVVGPMGPHDLPVPLGPLFDADGRAAAA